MMKLSLFLFLITFFIDLSVGEKIIKVVEENGPELSVHSGSIKGRTVELRPAEGIRLGAKVYQFLGIPFAEPPVNELRFKRPVPKKHWDGVLETTKWGAFCSQPPFPGVNEGVVISEDCLVLNVFVPQPAFRDSRKRSYKISKKRPVMLWIFGSGFRIDSASNPKNYDGTALAALKDVIVVTVNHRLGPLGWLYLPEAGVPGNMGFWDQLLAMKWVKENIARFGGDPDQITIFGESSGAMSVAAHIVSPQSKGLFKNAIIQSGSILDLPRWTIDGIGKKFISEINCTSNVNQCLQSYKPGVNPKADVLQCWPVVGDEFLPEYPEQIIAKRKFDTSINVLLGTVGIEGAYTLFFRDRVTFNPVNPANLTISQTRNIFAKIFGSSLLNYFEERYLTGVPQNDPQKLRLAIAQAVGETIFGCPTYIFGRELVKAGVNNVYSYFMSQKPSVSYVPMLPANQTWLPPTHYDDVPIVFGYPFMDPSYYNDEDVMLSMIMMDGWTDFAKTGNPGPYGQQPWLSWSVSLGLTMNLNSKQIGTTNEIPYQRCSKYWPFPLEIPFNFELSPGSLSGNGA